MKLSRRLPWSGAPNRLSERVAARPPALDLTVSNPTAVGLSYPVEDLAAALADPGVARYEPSPLGLAAAREAVAADHARRGVTIDPGRTVLTSSSSESYALLFKLLADPGDTILVPQPSYPLFDHLVHLEGLVARPYRLVWDGRWRIDHDTVDFDGARAICLVNPNNPTGSFVTEDDLDGVTARATSAGAAVIVDEVFADYAFARPPDAVASAAGREMGTLTFSLGGLSKSCGLPQMKLGWITVGGPTAMVESALGGLDLVCDAYLSVTTPVQLAAARLLALGAGIRAQIFARVAANRRTLEAAIAPESPCTLLPVEGGWSAILRVPAVVGDEDWALMLLEEDGVLVQPGYFFDLTMGATLVLSLLVEPAVFSEGLRRVLSRAERSS